MKEICKPNAHTAKIDLMICKGPQAGLDRDIAVTENSLPLVCNVAQIRTKEWKNNLSTSTCLIKTAVSLSIRKVIMHFI